MKRGSFECQLIIHEYLGNNRRENIQKISVGTGIGWGTTKKVLEQLKQLGSVKEDVVVNGKKITRYYQRR